MTKELKPCPFCHSQGMVASTLDDMYRPMCKTDGCCALDGYNTRAEAITAWNARAPDPRIAELEAENKRLREALDWMEYTEPGVVDAIRMRVARAALGESHD